jgi:hypothetical protein
VWAFRNLSKGVARTDHPAPVLGESCYREVVSGHRAIDVPNLETESTNPATQFRILARNHVVVVSPNAFEHLTPHQRVAAAEVAWTSRFYPLQCKHTIVDRAARRYFTAITEDYRNVRVVKFADRVRDKIRVEDGVAIDEEHDFGARGTPSGITPERGARSFRLDADDARCTAPRGILHAVVG